MKIGFRGSVASTEDARISVFDHGFLYGMGLFETFRTYGGRPYLLEGIWIAWRRAAAGFRSIMPLTRTASGGC